ncbi:UDP-3-O-(3-hydroxymyristoyl)glucosamine N-acyltransferase [Paenibacillus elgii]|uniref:UDP-3-O-(3-hydroxymyristoyl)glucosamine N-acyltransferase n=1 Tax=Paenibacillus elgii TaxID=189691 RepID=UPI000248C3F2|nr:UDP-3-O-(3-hydroxymyristoyl)glucosamine N-acyltransferase [Paenibacillus elgii]
MNELGMAPVSASILAQSFGLEVKGKDIPIGKFGNLSSKTNFPEMQLTYVNNYLFLEQFNKSPFGICIINETLKDSLVDSKTYLITKDDPEKVFYIIFMYYHNLNKFQSLTSYQGSNNKISKTAVIHESVIIGNDCIIMDNVVILPNTIIGDRVTIKPNTVIGGDGFQVKIINGKRKIIPHVGGVEIQDDVEVGSSVCIEKGLFGEFTFIGKESKVDNLVHISHSDIIGEQCTIAAGTSIAGVVTIGNHVWMGLNCSINQLLTIGDNSFIGTGSVVVKPVHSHEKVFGSPARTIGWTCKCRGELKMINDEYCCPKCLLKYKLIDNKMTLI